MEGYIKLISDHHGNKAGVKSIQVQPTWQEPSVIQMQEPGILEEHGGYGHPQRERKRATAKRKQAGTWTHGLLRSFPCLFLWFLSKSGGGGGVGVWRSCSQWIFHCPKWKIWTFWFDYLFFCLCALFSLVKKHEVGRSMGLQSSISSCSSLRGGISNGQTYNSTGPGHLCQLWLASLLSCKNLQKEQVQGPELRGVC